VKRLICFAIRLRCAKNPLPVTGFSGKIAFAETKAAEVYIYLLGS
jgi:hypothetical protein